MPALSDPRLWIGDTEQGPLPKTSVRARSLLRWRALGGPCWSHGPVGDGVRYDEERVFKRSALIAVPIDARAQHRPDEPRYRYEPFAGLEDDFRLGDEIFERVVQDYNLNDLAI